MDIDTLKQVVESAIDDKLGVEFYFSLFCIYLIGLILAEFISGYLKERGKNYATKDDIKNINMVLRENTRVVEQTKAEINSKIHEEQNVNAIKRDRLEKLLIELSNVPIWHKKQLEKMRNLIEDPMADVAYYENDPEVIVDMYCRLYFDKCIKDSDELSKIIYEYRVWVSSAIAYMTEISSKANNLRLLAETPGKAVGRDIVGEHEELLNQLTEYYGEKCKESIKLHSDMFESYLKLKNSLLNHYTDNLKLK